MSNPEFTYALNNNEVSMNDTENCINNGGDLTNGAQHDTHFNKNVKGDSNVSKSVKEKNIQQNVFGIGKGVSSANGKNSSTLSEMEVFTDGSTESLPSDIAREDNCLKCRDGCQHKRIPVGSETIDDLESTTRGKIPTGENTSDITNYLDGTSSLNNECLFSLASQSDTKYPDVPDDMSLEVRLGHSQPISSNLNIIPNPNEFNLVGKNNVSDFLNLNGSLALSDSSIVISNSNAIPQSDSIVSSNYSLSQLQQYISDDEDGDGGGGGDSVLAVPLQYREADQQMEDSDDSDSSTSSSTSILISESSSDSESEDDYENCIKPVSQPIKAKGELDLCDLPPIEDLTISVPEEECTPVGKIYQIVDQLVIVQANKDTPAYDLDTVLFTQGGKPLGAVFDVMGPVAEPYYCIRFNSKDHIKQQNITLDQTVYAAPKTKYSKFVFLAQLMQLKGSDASWENDYEPPEIYLDYSDDEQEQRAKKKLHRNKKAACKTDSDPDEPARKKHSAYEKRMNARNLRLSATRGNLSHNKNRAENVLWQPNLPSMMGASPPPARGRAPCHQMFGRPPLFDLRVPPPNPPFPSRGGLQFHRPCAGPSMSSRSQGLLPYSGPFASQGPPLFPRPTASQGPPLLPRPTASQGPPPFPRPIASQGPPPFPRPTASQGPPPFPQPTDSQGPPPFPRPSASQGPPPFPQPSPAGPHPFSRLCTSPGASPFPRPSNGPRMSPFSSPPSYCGLPSNRGLSSTSPGWNSSFPKSDNPWGSPFLSSSPISVPSPLRGAPAPPIGPFPSAMDFSGPFSNRASSPRGPHFNASPLWSRLRNNQGNSPQFNFNPSVPPPSPTFYHN